MKVSVVGAGLGAHGLLTQIALETIKKADLVITTGRLHEKFNQLNENCISLPLCEIEAKIESAKALEHIVVLASGDIGFYSISKSLKSLLEKIDVAFINGISSLQYLSAKLNISYEGIRTVSVHGREQSAIPFVCYNQTIFVLTGGKYKAHHVIEQLVSAGLGAVKVTVGENLSDTTEQILTGTAQELMGKEFDNLTVLLIENSNAVSGFHTLLDSDFIRGKVPMTKEDIRNLSLVKLDILPTDVVYDIGAGTGSVAIAMAYKARENFVYAIEMKEVAVDLIHQNIMKLGANNVKVITAKAPEGLTDLPAPDKVFIGGSSGNLAAIFTSVLEKNAKAKIVVNALTLQTLTEAIACFAQHNIETNTICVNISVAEKLGRYDMMKSQNPIYIISGARHE